MIVGTPQQIAMQLFQLDKDKKYKLEEYKEKRSKDANAYFHALVNQLARYYDISDAAMKIKMNLDYGTIETDANGKIVGCKVPKGTDMTTFYEYAKWYKEDKDGCDCYIFYKRTHALNSLEFSKLLNGVVQECKDAGIETLDEREIKSLLDNYNVS
jgi:hypothetical protein